MIFLLLFSTDDLFSRILDWRVGVARRRHRIAPSIIGAVSEKFLSNIQAIAILS
ncbi:hypothetical protein PQG02_21255 [Nostoc sp. UHCC 0926]|uniref:hypothetical protein n=1 Tax=unclassified Nostoc TaxID=2593658 RepID=UPI002361956B|nr:hypothetical protein [Nostoc sp. UHCC 0926]WDD31237.1 hypothetical protein PQG02_21255 [Nostoc sp. UHCC 0926]